MNYPIKIGLSIIFVFSSILFVRGQQFYTTTNKRAIKSYNEAEKLFYDRDYKKASESLLKSISYDNFFIEAHILLSYSYSSLSQNTKAIDELKTAIGINPNFHQGNFFTLARLQLLSGLYKEAKNNFLQFLQKPVEDADIKNMAERDLLNCDFAINAIENPVPFKPVNAGSGLNSQYDEYFPCMTADEQTFLFTRKLPVPNSREGWQEDFYVSDWVNGKWNTAYSIGPKINTETNEGAPTLSSDGKILFFVVAEDFSENPGEHNYGLGRKGFGSCDIFYAVKEGNEWSKPKNAGPGVNSYHWETQPSFSSDGKTLYFIRGQVKAHAIHNPDIYMAVLGENGQFGAATRLSDVINTKGDEESVFIHPDNQTLYFSSNGRPGMGGLDLYFSRRKSDGSWGEPTNIGYPINTWNDENSLLVSRDGSLAYFASDRAGGLGGLDIYSFDLPEAVRPGKTIFVKGKIFDGVSKIPLDADIDVVDLESGNSVVKWKSGKKNGEFLICLPVNKNYAVNISKPGYLFHSENFALNETKEYQPFALSVPLFPIAKDSTVVLKNVFFETNKFDLKSESKVELDKLVLFLQNNSTLKIELRGHTDNVGDKKSNQILSENRAKSVCEYMVANKIAKERLTYKGYGDTCPIVLNDSEEHRHMNRRTEFKITSQ